MNKKIISLLLMFFVITAMLIFWWCAVLTGDRQYSEPFHVVDIDVDSCGYELQKDGGIRYDYVCKNKKGFSIDNMSSDVQVDHIDILCGDVEEHDVIINDEFYYTWGLGPNRYEQADRSKIIVNYNLYEKIKKLESMRFVFSDKIPGQCLIVFYKSRDPGLFDLERVGKTFLSLTWLRL
jgi:hypothetical protein